ncbi:interleukin-6-like [Gambusia affinis]|uniref:interleukin-6-like n=1 Tax=Gambusia affinis TaxID=33528 RepID=UPI001CDCF6BF|nr:interleukin-6-like [Gambusia affinis]
MYSTFSKSFAAGTAASSFLYLGLFSSSFHSFIHSFTRGSDLRLLAALMLAAALPLCVPGAPLDGAVTDLPPEESSGEGEEEVQTKPCPTDPFNITETLAQILKVTKGHKEEVRALFLKLFEFIWLVLTHLTPSLFYDRCVSSFFLLFGRLTAPAVTFQEARLQQLAQDLTTYSVLLKHVDKEYPGRFTVTELKAALPRLIAKVKRTMRNADRVVALTGSQELQLLEEPGSLDSYHRKMMAHSILSSIHDFLVEWKRELTKRQVRRTN